MSEQAPPTVSETTAPVPAPAAPETQPATQAAVTAGSTRDYRVARRAERSGKPFNPVPLTAPTAAPGASAPSPAAETPPASPAPPRPRREDTYISDRIREGVERGTAEIRSEIERLKQQVQAHTPAPEAPKPYDGTDPSDPKPAPDDFDDFNKYLDARDIWNERRVERKQSHTVEGTRRAQAHEELTAAQQTRVQKFADQIQTASTADPEFANRLTPEVRALRPFAALAPGEPGGPDNVVADQLFDSPIAPQVLRHFSEHPEALARLIAMPTEIQAMPQRVRTHHHVQWIVKEFGKIEAALSAPTTTETPAPAPSKPLTQAPPPAQTLGSRPAPAVDPKTAAVKSGNTQEYREIRRRERAEQMIGRR